MQLVSLCTQPLLRCKKRKWEECSVNLIHMSMIEFGLCSIGRERASFESRRYRLAVFGQRDFDMAAPVPHVPPRRAEARPPMLPPSPVRRAPRPPIGPPLPLLTESGVPWPLHTSSVLSCTLFSHPGGCSNSNHARSNSKALCKNWCDKDRSSGVKKPYGSRSGLHSWPHAAAHN